MKNDTTPATKADIDRLEAVIHKLGTATKADMKSFQQALTKRFDRIDERFDYVDENITVVIDTGARAMVGV